MEEKKEEIFELDLSTPEGKQQAKERIKEGLFRFNGIDKIFFTNLLFLLLNTISEQEVSDIVSSRYPCSETPLFV